MSCFNIFFQSLAKLKEEFLGHKNGGSSPDVSTLSIPHMSNTASQTDLRGEVRTRNESKEGALRREAKSRSETTWLHYNKIPILMSLPK